MDNNKNMESSIRQSLQEKAGEMSSSEQLFSDIMERIEKDRIGGRSMSKNRMLNLGSRRWIAASVCGIFVMMAVMFTFSEDVRAATREAVNTIRNIFVLEKSDNGDYQIVEKSGEEPLFYPIISTTSHLNDEELTQKMGFKVYFPDKLSDELSIDGRGEAVGINEKISDEVSQQIESLQLKAISDENAFNQLLEYMPYRSVFAYYSYVGDGAVNIFIEMSSADNRLDYGDNAISSPTKIGAIDAQWIEIISPNYAHINENGIGRSDIYSNPNETRISRVLTWTEDGIQYQLECCKKELTMEEAVQLAENFMAAQK